MRKPAPCLVLPPDWVDVTDKQDRKTFAMVGDTAARKLPARWQHSSATVAGFLNRHVAARRDTAAAGQMSA
jgi:hypothetical protein